MDQVWIRQTLLNGENKGTYEAFAVGGNFQLKFKRQGIHSMSVSTSGIASYETLRRRLRVAQGHEAGDLLLTDAQVVNVFTQRVEPANVIVVDGWIAGVGPYDWQAAQSLSLSGKTILPGFIDSHAHLESTLLTPAELARLIVPHGTTALISDSH